MGSTEHSEKEIFDRVASLVRRLLMSSEEGNLRGIPEFSWETDIFNDLGIDSVEAMDLMVLIEQEFNVAVEVGLLAAKPTLGGMTTYIRELRQRV